MNLATGKFERGHEEASLIDATWALFIWNDIQGFAAVFRLKIVVAFRPDPLENQARHVLCRVLANAAVPTVVVPRHADREMANRISWHFRRHDWAAPETTVRAF